MPAYKDMKILPRDVARRAKTAGKAAKSKIDLAATAKAIGKKSRGAKAKKSPLYDWYQSAKERFSIAPKRGED